MNTKFKRHDEVRFLVDANPEFVEYHNPDHEEEVEEELEKSKKMPEIKKGMKGRINLLLSNGQYHVEVLDKKDKIMAYAKFNEEDLESL